MGESSGRPEPPVLKREGFQFCRDQFSVAGIGRYQGSVLRELFNPGTLRLKRDQKAAKELAGRLFKKAFFAAQLRHYGIKVSSSAKISEVRDLLEDSVHQGKCARVPDSVTRLEQAMRRDYEPLLQKWESDVRAYDEKEKKQKEAEFAKCATPGEKATYDLDRFMDHYFLTDGQPDKTKTPEPLALHGYGNRWQIHEKAEKVSGLYSSSGGSGSKRTVCVGWNAVAVRNLARDIDSQIAKEKQERRETQWKQKIDNHQQYVKHTRQKDTGSKARGATTKKTGPKAFDLGRCQGSYVVQCKELEEGWPESCQDGLTMDIFKDKGGIMKANFDFGMMEGVMLLCLDEERLNAMALADDDEDSNDDDDEDEDDEEDDEDDDDDGSSDDHRNNNGKRRLKRTEPDVTSSNRKGKGAKMRKLTPSMSRRVYYRLRGRETGEGQIHSDPEPGHLDFLSDGCSKFAGLAYQFPYAGTNIEFQGYKVSDKPSGRAEDWEDFDDQAYAYANTRRWF